MSGQLFNLISKTHLFHFYKVPTTLPTSFYSQIYHLFPFLGILAQWLPTTAPGTSGAPQAFIKLL